MTNVALNKLPEGIAVTANEEWGILYAGDRRPYETHPDRDYLIDKYKASIHECEEPPKLVRRYVTDWKEVRA